MTHKNGTERIVYENYIAMVAHQMTNGAAFPAYNWYGEWDGVTYVEKCDVDVYYQAVYNYLVGLGAPIPKSLSVTLLEDIADYGCLLLHPGKGGRKRRDPKIAESGGRHSDESDFSFERLGGRFPPEHPGKGIVRKGSFRAVIVYQIPALLIQEDKLGSDLYLFPQADLQIGSTQIIVLPGYGQGEGHKVFSRKFYRHGFPAQRPVNIGNRVYKPHVPGGFEQDGEGREDLFWSPEPEVLTFFQITDSRIGAVQ